jgi:hypothetical protein
VNLFDGGQISEGISFELWDLVPAEVKNFKVEIFGEEFVVETLDQVIVQKNSFQKDIFLKSLGGDSLDVIVGEIEVLEIFGL